MKIKCIKNNGWSHTNITVGKTYDVIEYDKDGNYLIIDDAHCKSWYLKFYFEPAVAEMRNDKINKLLE